MPDDYRFLQGDGSLVEPILDEMADVYEEVYAEPPYNSGPLWQREAFTNRTQRQATRPGFAIVLAQSDDGELVGYSFGLPFPAGGWWSGNASSPPTELLAAPKFALIELVVRASWRGRGIGHEMHNAILSNRAEPHAILTAVPTAPARHLYRRWGWNQVGTAHHVPDSPLLDALVLSLPLRSKARI